jgi:glycosyltransferase involved in cell wall biosynthesis
MLLSRLYYSFKPWMPLPLRMAMRRWWTKRHRPAWRDVWPIKQGTETPPINWPGWPDGKRFALVLTHDIETRAGLERCPQIMELEAHLGLRSSFNFIPEASYHTPAEFREKLTSKGFEVGVHDLRHDGKLYRSRERFKKQAIKINKYLKEWNAVGFRSGFMHHKLDWLHELDIQYDMSTFDTDPFEPQPDGADTIFPFWVPGNGDEGYMELPYTLPQDSTLYLLFEENSIEVWKKKLDWIVEHNGMALVNVHPDYLQFNGKSRRDIKTVAAHYECLLRYVREKYGDSFWNPLPRELAQYCTEFKPLKKSVEKKRICMVSHSHYESDNRILRYAEALADRGDEVEVVALKKNPSQSNEEYLGPIYIRRIQERLDKTQTKTLGYLFPLLRFCLVSSCWLLWRHTLRPFDVIHVHNVPDFLAFAAWFPRLTGAKVILDIHDIVPEFYGSKFQKGTGSVPVRALKLVERCSARFANHVIISNHLWFETFTARSAPREKCSVFINHVDPAVFYPRKRTRNDGKIIIIFPGGLQWHQGVDVAIKAFAEVTRACPETEFHIYGEGSMKPSLIELAHDLNLEKKVLFFDPIPIRQIADVIANADVGVVPKRADSFGNEAYSTKIMEFMSQGLPVVLARTKIDQFYFDDSVVRFFESGNEKEMAQAILEVINNPDLRQELAEAGLSYVKKNGWQNRKKEYLDLIDLFATGRPTVGIRVPHRSAAG